MFTRVEALADAADEQHSTRQSLECASYDIQLPKPCSVISVSATPQNLICFYDQVALFDLYCWWHDFFIEWNKPYLPTHSYRSLKTVAEWLGRGTPWSCWRQGVRKVVSSIPGRGNIVGWVFHPTRWLARFSLIWICLSFQILNLFLTLSSWGNRNYSRSRLSSIT